MEFEWLELIRRVAEALKRVFHHYGVFMGVWGSTGE